MLPVATIALIVEGIQAAVSAAPQVKELVLEAKNFIAGLFGKGLISKAQQDSIHANIDSIVAMAEAGIVPPELQVEPDPV